MPQQYYYIVVDVIPAEEGGYYAVGLNLPGLISQGETLEEVTANIADAAQLLVETLLCGMDGLPFVAADEPHRGQITVFNIVVDME